MSAQRDAERAERAAAELQEAVREARGMVKDLRQLLNEARTLTRDTITADLDEQMAEMRRRTREAMETSADKIMKEFQVLGDRIMQRDRRAQARGLAPMEVVVEAAAAGLEISTAPHNVPFDEDVVP